MLYKFLQDALNRHLIETLPIINQLTDSIVMSKPLEKGRPLGEIILHMLRSMEFYSRGLADDIWEPLVYSLDEYETADAIKGLAREIFTKTKEYLKRLEPESLSREITLFNRPAAVAEIFHEMIEHSIHHRGQITIYYRLIGIKPSEIKYII